MSKFRARFLALVLSVAAVAAAGCGSSSSSKSAAQPPAASTPASPSTPSTPSTTTAPSSAEPTGLSPSTPLSSSEFKSAWAAGLVKKLHATEAQATKYVDCVVPKLEAAGITTGAELKSAPTSKTTPISQQCIAGL